jgi:hypothetical protein
MTMQVEQARTAALADIERTERHYKLAFFGAVVTEAVLIGVLVYAADLSNRTHLLLLAGFLGSYSIVVLAIVALGAHVSRVGQRVLRAIESGSRPGS